MPWANPGKTAGNAIRRRPVPRPSAGEPHARPAAPAALALARPARGGDRPGRDGVLPVEDAGGEPGGQGPGQPSGARPAGRRRAAAGTAQPVARGAAAGRGGARGRRARLRQGRPPLATRPGNGGNSSTTLPPSEPEVMLEALPATWAAKEHAGERGHD